MPSEIKSSKVLTLLFTDLEGSTALKAKKGDDTVSMLMARHRDLIKTLAQEESGRIIDWAGDGCFLTFEKPSSAVRFSLILIQAHENDSDLPNVRIGIHMGEITEISGSDDDIKTIKVEGLAVDIASRIQSLAMPGQILMSNAVFNSVRQRLNSKDFDYPITWRAHGAYLFKGLDDPIQLGEIGIEGVSPLEAPQSYEKAKRSLEIGEEQILGWRPSPGLFIPGRPNWKLNSQIGAGGFGEVWLAINVNTYDKHVFKFCFQPDRLRGLKREVVLLRLLKEALGDREDIARVIDWNLNTQPYYIETEFTEGGNLKTWFEEQGGSDKVPIESRLELVAQIATALSAAHSAGVLHKDIKPSNILIAQSKDNTKPRACLADFGIGLLTDPDALEKRGITSTGLTQTLIASKSSSGTGTALYMAPEIFEGKPPTPQSDIYSLGAILYQIVIGDFSRVIAPGWERDIDDDLLREDIALCVDGLPENRLKDAAELARRLRSIKDRRNTKSAQYRHKRIKKYTYYGIALALIVVISTIFGIRQNKLASHKEKESWAYKIALPEIKKYIEGEDYIKAYVLALKARQFIPEDPTLAEYIDQSTQLISIKTEPSGASVSYKPYKDPYSEWIEIGITPIEKTRMPIGIYRWKISKKGFVIREVVASVRDPSIYPKGTVEDVMEDGFGGFSTLIFKLYQQEIVPDGMICVDAGKYSVAITGLPPLANMPFDYFFIDRTEVTNKAYKEFIDAGGYENQDYWNFEFKKEGQDIEWSEAIKTFVDKTGHFGPSTWEFGNYQKGQDNYPVSGVSWFEAVAYANFRGKSIPTIFHWARAALATAEIVNPLSPIIVSQSNINKTDPGCGPAKVGTFSGLSINGAYDMAGNVREWCWNSSGGNRYCLGGDWDDPPYSFTLPIAPSPWDRSPFNGFRCAIYPEDTKKQLELFADINLGDYNFLKIPPASDDVVNAIKNMWSYTKSPLRPSIEGKKTWDSNYREEIITIDAVYNNERIILHIYLPVKHPPPYKAIIYFPGLDALSTPAYGFESHLKGLDVIPKSGRAQIIPVFSGMWERSDEFSLARLMSPHTIPVILKEWVQDLGRVIDYLEFREDIDTENIAYNGISLGVVYAPYLLAFEKRIKVAILVTGGLYGSPIYSMLDSSLLPHTYLPHVTIPVLMLNGQYDYVMPVKISQKPFFNRLGTPREHKRHVIYDGYGHAPLPYIETINETLAWLDKYQGPVSLKSE